MQYEVVQSRDMPGEWRVEAIDYNDDGKVYVAIFSGPHSEERAIQDDVRLPNGLGFPRLSRGYHRGRMLRP